MSRGGIRERLAIHLCAVSSKWPNDGRDGDRWRLIRYESRDRWRFLASHAIRFLRDEDRRDHEAEVAADEGPLGLDGDGLVATQALRITDVNGKAIPPVELNRGDRISISVEAGATPIPSNVRLCERPPVGTEVKHRDGRRGTVTFLPDLSREIGTSFGRFPPEELLVRVSAVPSPPPPTPPSCGDCGRLTYQRAGFDSIADVCRCRARG